MWCRGKTKGIYNLILSYLDSTFSDHGIFRLFWRSWAKLPGDMFRCNQPYPHQIKKDIRKYKIKSIINLRGERHCSSYYLEKNFCFINKIKLYNFPVSSRDVPDKEKLLKFIELVNKVEYPCVMHCKSGADRAGLAAALYLIYKHNYSLEEAIKQLTFKHLHIKYAKTGILDYFFLELIKKGINNKKDLIFWINNKYDKQTLKNNFKASTFFNFLIDNIIKRE